MIDQLPALNEADRNAISAPLGEHNRRAGLPWQPKPVVLAIRTERGDIVGGLIGQLQWEYLRIEILAVPEQLRGQGWGRKLVERAEQIALGGGCRHAWVDTFSFQSPGFYERLGYRRFGELRDYPGGETRYFFTRALSLPTG